MFCLLFRTEDAVTEILPDVLLCAGLASAASTCTLPSRLYIGMTMMRMRMRMRIKRMKIVMMMRMVLVLLLKPVPTSFPPG